MKNITIDFISSSNIYVNIDGERIDDIAEVIIEIKKENETFRFQKAVQKEQKQLNNINNTAKNMPQWRSIHKAAEELKAEDPNTAISEWRIRELVAKGEISYTNDNKGKLVDLNEIRHYFNNKKRSVVNTNTKIKAIY
ncbi:MAG: hypothetical protein HFE57_05990 [Firmicutes bacterium]|jgi:hypothetical protein|nr:hypothetical protein [Bacillota bacterium]